MAALGYTDAKYYLTKQPGWDLLVTCRGESVERIQLHHGGKNIWFTVRTDSGRKLMQECFVVGNYDYRTAIMRYDFEKEDVI